MSWKEYAYSDWNERLFRHHFIADPPVNDQLVERVIAMPEELSLVVGDPHTPAVTIADAFVAQVRSQLPRGKESFSGYCLDYRGWTTDSAVPPRSFGMLWFTCLIAYGYPSPDLNFYQRLHLALGKKDNLQYRDGDGSPSCVPRLWAEFHEWTRKRRAAGAMVRPLSLPTDVGRRTAIGLSWFLTFPHQRDRAELAKCLWDAGLVGPGVGVRERRDGPQRNETQDRECGEDFLLGGHHASPDGLQQEVRREEIEELEPAPRHETRS